MEITEVRIKLVDDPSEKLQAFCSITFDNCFVVRDLKIIEGTNGPFVAMPSRKLTAHCQQCGSKNHLRAPYCNQCGARLKEERLMKDNDGRVKLYADIAHPINSSCREMIQNRVIEEFEEELVRAQQPGYVCRYDDFDYEFEAVDRAARQSRPEPSRTESSRTETSRTESSRTEQTHIQPAAQEPRPPHRTGSGQTAGSKRADAGHGHVPGPKGGSGGPHKPDFGAGIL